MLKVSKVNVNVSPVNNLQVKLGQYTKQLLALNDLTDVDALNPLNNQVLTFDASANKYIVKYVQVDSNNILSINGGTF